MNENLALFLNTLATNNTILKQVGIFLASDLPFVLIGILCYFVYKSTKRVQEKHIHTFIFAIISGLIARYLFKWLIVLSHPVARPYIGMKEITLLISPITHQEFQSFPSGHALFFFAVSTALFFHHKKLGIFFFISSVLMGIGRVMVGVHYPLDILGGALIGITTSYGLSFIIKKYYTL